VIAEETSRLVEVEHEVDKDSDTNPPDEDGDAGRKHGPVMSLVRKTYGWLKVRLLIIVLAIFTTASVALVVALYYLQYRPDQATDAKAAESVISTATEATRAILSYSPDTIDRDLSNAKSYLTGDFLTYYSQFTQQILAPTAKEKAAKTSAVVIRAAVAELHPDSAVIMVFLNQTTTSKERPEPTLNASSVLVSLTKVDGKWLVSSFEPV
jgi:Mce-associated membrane protein